MTTTNPIVGASTYRINQDIDVRVIGGDVLGFKIRPLRAIDVAVGNLIEFEIVEVERRVVDRG